jgi:16S rRNA (cytosine967-C5)-methyltransferase
MDGYSSLFGEVVSVKFAGRVQAAIEVLHEVLTRHRPAAEALKDWGKVHRFAGSGDRHAIGTLVYDSLRQRSSLAAQGGGEDARHVILGLLRVGWDMSIVDIAALADGQHGPAALTADEEKALGRTPSALPWYVTANVPEWLAPDFEKMFGKTATDEGQALSQRAPIDLRVNTLKSDRVTLRSLLSTFSPTEGPWVKTSLRIAAPNPEQKHINVEVDPAHGMGLFEVQDTASQIAAALTGVKAGETVADICAGAGGKTLALAALMENKGRLVAHDVDRHRLRPIFERVMRAGASCVEVVSADQSTAMKDESFDCVVVDAPCSGTGTWRRKPEIKWKLTRKTLDVRLTEQRNVLENGAKLVRKGGRLVYFTCSLLPQENSDQVKAFLAGHKDFKIIPYAEQWACTIGGQVPKSADGAKDTLLLTPHQHDVDGFFIAVLQRT